MIFHSLNNKLSPSITPACFLPIRDIICAAVVFVRIIVLWNCRVALSRHTKINSKPFNKRSQEFQIKSKINKITTSPSLRSVQYSVLELFAKQFHPNLWSSGWRRHIGVRPWYTNMAAGYQRKHLEFTFTMKAITFASELVYFHVNTSPNTWNVQAAKNAKERPFFQTRQLCHGAILMSRMAENSKIQNALV